MDGRSAMSPRLRAVSPNGKHPNSEPLKVELPAVLVEAIAQRVVELLVERLEHTPEPYLDAEQAAEYLVCRDDEGTLRPDRIYELRAQGRLSCHRDGRRLLFRREDLDAALQREEVGA